MLRTDAGSRCAGFEGKGKEIGKKSVMMMIMVMTKNNYHIDCDGVFSREAS